MTLWELPHPASRMAYQEAEDGLRQMGEVCGEEQGSRAWTREPDHGRAEGRHSVPNESGGR